MKRYEVIFRGAHGHGNAVDIIQLVRATDLKSPLRHCAIALTGLACFALVLCTGCATTPPQIPMTGDILVDGPRMMEEGPTKDKVLWQYRTAAAAMRQAKFDVANPLLDDALLTLRGIYGSDAEARKARGYFSKEARKTFIGEPYERSMAYFYRGVIYWREGELDNARACFRSAEFEDSDAEKSEYKGDWVLPDYLDGLATAKLAGDGKDALERAKKSSRNINLPDYELQANVLFVMEFGAGPMKIGAGEYHEQLRFRTRNTPLVSARIKTGAIDLPVAPCDDLNYQATTRGGRVMDHVLGNKAVFKSTTDKVGDLALIGGLTTAAVSDSRTSQNVGLGIAAAGLVAKLISAAATPDADTRAWDNLPQFISFAAVQLPVGEHAVTIDFLDATGKANERLTKLVNVSVTATDRDTVVFVSDCSTTPQNQ
jgi:tetratricopeptide (TPR) repeat protein